MTSHCITFENRMKFQVGQSVEIIGPAQDGDASRIGQTGLVLYGVGDGSRQIIVMFGTEIQAFSVDVVKVV